MVKATEFISCKHGNNFSSIPFRSVDLTLTTYVYLPLNNGFFLLVEIFFPLPRRRRGYVLGKLLLKGGGYVPKI